MNEKTKAKVKQSLIYISVFLAMLWFVVLLYGIFVEKEVSNNIALRNGEKVLIDITKSIDGVVVKNAKNREEFEEDIHNILSKPKNLQNSEANLLHDKKNEPLSKNAENHPNGTREDNNDPVKSHETQNNTSASLNKPQEAVNIESASNVNHDSGFAKIAIFISNLGGNQSILESALALPGDFTFGFSGLGNSTNNAFETLIKSGKNVLIYLPFGSKDYPVANLGPYEILESQGTDTNIQIIDKLIELYPGIKGVYANSRESFSAKKQNIEPIIDTISHKNLTIVLARQITPSDEYLANKQNVIFCDQIIDQESTTSGIKTSLAELVAIAKKKGYAVGYANTYPITLKLLSDWVKDLPNLKIKIVPLTELKNENKIQQE
ncbi:MAG: divergent polysaccharide deacetylase family protein [Rickettsiaceae bacterium]|nr:divergent polysaccharide deacetylase family protein [Rickettsiaceae bacterium]